MLQAFEMLGFVVALLGRFLARISRRSALRTGAVLGLVWFHVVRIRRRHVLRSLAASFPEWDRRRRLEIARALYVNLGRWAAEFLRVVCGRDRADDPGDKAAARGADDPRVPDESASVTADGMERYDRAVAGGRGVIVATAHLGNFDLAACAMAASGKKLTLLSRSLTNRGLNRRWMEWRRRFGVEILDEGSPLPALADVLRRGGTLVLLIDQATPPDLGGARVPFLGRPAWTTRLPALLSLRTGAPIIPVFTESRSDGTHVVHVEEPIETQPSDLSGGGLSSLVVTSVDPDAVLRSDESAIVTPPSVSTRLDRLTFLLNDRLESRVRSHPEQWMWLHRRWKEFGDRRAYGPTASLAQRKPME